MIQPNQILQFNEDQKEAEILAELSLQIKNFRERNAKEYNLNHENEAINFLRLSLIKILENKVYSLNQNSPLELKNFRNQWNSFEKELEILLLNEEKIPLINQKIVSFFRQININEVQINKMIEMKKLERFSTSQITSIYKDYGLENLLNITGIINVIGNIIYHLETLNRYDFYNFLLLILIQQKLMIVEFEQNEEKDPSKILQDFELALVKKVINNNESQNFEEFIKLGKFQSILKHKQINDFCLARYFTRHLSMISDNYNNDRQMEISVFINIRDQSLIGKLNFMKDEFKGPLKYLKEKYELNQSYEIKLIKMVQASAFIQNFQQEAGNAFTVLSFLLASLSNQDFSKINVTNCLLNNIQFFSCNFNSSTMNNVSMVSAQFINCSIKNASWKNLESSCLKILKSAKQTIFSSHPQILIQQNCQKQISAIGFLNLITDKQITSSYTFQDNDYNKKVIKLSCFGQVLVILKDYHTLFWNIQTKKQIRSFNLKSIGGSHIMSSDCQVMAHFTVENEINLYKIYEAKENSKIIVEGLPLDKYNRQNTIEFSKDNSILIIKGDQSAHFLRVSDGEEMYKTIYFDDSRNKRIEYFLDGKFFVLIENLTFSIWNVEEGIKLLSFEYQYYPHIKLSPDRSIFVFQVQNRIYYWSLKNLQWLKNCDYLPGYKSSDIKFQFFDEQTIMFSHDNKIIFSKIDSQKQYYCLEGLSNKNFNFVFSLDKQFLLSSLYDYNLTYLWNLKYYQKYLDFENNAIWKTPSKLFLSPTNNLIGLVYDSSSIQVRVLKDLKVIHELNFQEKIPESLILSPDLNKIAFFQDNQLFIQKIENGEVISVQKMKKKEELIKKQQQPKGEEVEQDEYEYQAENLDVELRKYIERQKKEIRVQEIKKVEEWEFEEEAQSEEEQVEIEIEEKDEVKLLAFSHNGDYLAIQSDIFESNNHVYQRTAKLIVLKLEGLEKHYCRYYRKGEYMYSFEFSKNNSSFAVGLNNKIKIVNINNRKSKYLKDNSVKAESDLNKVLSFSPNGQLLASGNQFCDSVFHKTKTIPEIRVWRIKDGGIIQRLVGHQKQITQIIFLIDELIIVSASEDCSIRIWNIEVGQQIQLIDFHKFGIVNLCISSDGSTMITSDKDGLICQWRFVENLKQQKMQKSIEEIENYDLQLMDIKNNKFNKGNLEVQDSDYYKLFKIIGNPRFRVKQCSIEESEFYSTEGFNIRSVFLSYDDLVK